MNKIRKGDTVVVLSGRDKGRTGAVLQVQPDGKVLVEGVNIVKKHARGNPQKNSPGGIVDKTMPLDPSKVGIWNAGAKKADRVGIRTLADGKRVRFLKSNNEVLDVK
ncbi:MAG TPA: 50S ribosomal protein L24 [Steroidobacteraceae bacterium]|nr:50S ribosomal protein L24 [Steroidobacteraceae bacterium]